MLPPYNTFTLTTKANRRLRDNTLEWTLSTESPSEKFPSPSLSLCAHTLFVSLNSFHVSWQYYRFSFNTKVWFIVAEHVVLCTRTNEEREMLMLKRCNSGVSVCHCHNRTQQVSYHLFPLFLAGLCFCCRLCLFFCLSFSNHSISPSSFKHTHTQAVVNVIVQRRDKCALDNESKAGLNAEKMRGQNHRKWEPPITEIREQLRYDDSFDFWDSVNIQANNYRVSAEWLCDVVSGSGIGHSIHRTVNARHHTPKNFDGFGKSFTVFPTRKTKLDKTWAKTETKRTEQEQLSWETSSARIIECIVGVSFSSCSHHSNDSFSELVRASVSDSLVHRFISTQSHFVTPFALHTLYHWMPTALYRRCWKRCTYIVLVQHAITRISLYCYHSCIYTVQCSHHFWRTISVR